MLANIARPYIFGAVALVISASVAWVFLIYGPSQHRAGASAAEARLDAATNEAAKGLSNAAEKNRFLLDQCRSSGGVFDFASGECQRG